MVQCLDGRMVNAGAKRGMLLVCATGCCCGLTDRGYQTEQLDPSKLPLLQRQIWETIQKNRLDDDLRYILKADHGDHSHDWDGALLEDGSASARPLRATGRYRRGRA